MDIEENKLWFYILGILLTVLTLVISTKYTYGNIKRIWNAGTPKPVVADEKEAHPGIIPRDEIKEDILAGNYRRGA